MKIVAYEELSEEIISTFKVKEGEEAFETFFKYDVGTATTDFLSKTYVAVENSVAVGFISMCTAGIRKKDIRRGFEISADFKHFPGILIGKLAVHADFRRQGIALLLWDKALEISLDIVQQVGARFVIVHSIREAINFYEKKLNFVALSSSENKSVIPMAFDLKKMLEEFDIF